MSSKPTRGGRLRSGARKTKKKRTRRSRACSCLECGFTEHLSMDAWSRLMERAREQKRQCPVHGDGS